MTPEEKLCSRSWRMRNSVGVLWSVLTFGFLTGVNFLSRGMRSKNRLWIGMGIGFLAVSLGLFIASSTGMIESGTKENPSTSVGFQIWGWVMTVSFIAGVIASFVTNKKWLLWKAHATDTKWYAQAAATQTPSSPAQAYASSSDAISAAFAVPSTPSAATPQPAPAAPVQHTATTLSDGVRINSATGEELVAALGIDVDTAGRIVTARTQGGPFTSFEQLIAAAQVPPHLLIPHRGLLSFESVASAPNPSEQQAGSTGRSSARRLDI